MGGVAGPELVAEVCRAGGLGILAGLNVPPHDLLKMIRGVRGLTDRPFGVTLWLHKALRPPIDPDTVPAETLDGAQAMLNRFRERLGIPTTATSPGRAPDLVDAAVAVVLEERPPVFSTALGWLEPRLAEACHRRGGEGTGLGSPPGDAPAPAGGGAQRMGPPGGAGGGGRSAGGQPPRPRGA